MALSLVYDWTTTLGFVFGGCCSNAITLEQLTSQHPNAGSLITLFQFVLISLHGLPRHITWTPYGPRFKPRRIPLTPYLIQVGLFYLVSLLNNAAFGYKIPMSVHIIFRSGGLIVSMLLGWLVSGKQYNLTQIVSVLLVTIGVVLTTLSATPSTSSSRLTDQADMDSWNYIIGISILSLALIFSGFLGLAQDWTYNTFGRPQPSATSSGFQPQWQESLFYLHFLSLPMFVFIRDDIKTQLSAISDGPQLSWTTPLPFPGIASPWLGNLFSRTTPLTTFTHTQGKGKLSFHIPYAYVPLLLNTMTQFLCASGVHRLTARVSSLTVTLILVVRKAASLLISVLGPGIIPGMSGGKTRTVDHRLMWSGAACVLVGTILYSVGTGRKPTGETKDKEE